MYKEQALWSQSTDCRMLLLRSRAFIIGREGITGQRKRRAEKAAREKGSVRRRR